MKNKMAEPVESSPLAKREICEHGWLTCKICHEPVEPPPLPEVATEEEDADCEGCNREDCKACAYNAAHPPPDFVTKAGTKIFIPQSTQPGGVQLPPRPKRDGIISLAGGNHAYYFAFTADAHFAALEAENESLKAQLQHLKDGCELIACVWCKWSVVDFPPEQREDLIRSHEDTCTDSPMAKLRSELARLQSPKWIEIKEGCDMPPPEEYVMLAMGGCVSEGWWSPDYKSRWRLSRLPSVPTPQPVTHWMRRPAPPEAMPKPDNREE
jgi:hypothetical protein